jgi:ferritin-like metal-binding protein YciE
VRRGELASAGLKERLVTHIDEAYALERNVLRLLDRMIETTEDRELKQELRQHRLETERHADRMQQRLEAHSATPSLVKQARMIAGALIKSVVDRGRGEQPSRNARDAYATEHLEIASYQLLERLARRAGDEETAAAARENRQDEEQLAKRLEAHWDTVAGLPLQEEGVAV